MPAKTASSFAPGLVELDLNPMGSPHMQAGEKNRNARMRTVPLSVRQWKAASQLPDLYANLLS